MKLGAWTGMGTMLPLVAMQPEIHDSKSLAHISISPIEVTAVVGDSNDENSLARHSSFTTQTSFNTQKRQFWKTTSIDSCYDSSSELNESMRLKDSLMMSLLESYHQDDDLNSEEIQKLHELLHESNPCIRGISLWLLAGSPNSIDVWTLQQAYTVERDERVKPYFETLLK